MILILPLAVSALFCCFSSLFQFIFCELDYAALDDSTVPQPPQQASSSSSASYSNNLATMTGAFDPATTDPWAIERDASPPLPNGLDAHIIQEIHQEEARREEEEHERYLLSTIGSIPVHQARIIDPPALPYNTQNNNSHKRKSSDGITPTFTPTFGVPKNSNSKGQNSGFSNASPKILRTVHPLISFPITLFQAFNGGDFKRVRDLISENTTRGCTLKTPALETEVVGNTHIIDLFSALSEAHPDAVFVAKKVKFNEELSELSCRIYFAGTRVSSSLRSLDITGTFAEHLFKRPGSSLTDEMNISLLTSQEISAMKELERKSLNLSVFGKGKMALLVDAETEKITRFHVDWVITSFREASL